MRQIERERNHVGHFAPVGAQDSVPTVHIRQADARGPHCQALQDRLGADLLLGSRTPWMTTFGPNMSIACSKSTSPVGQGVRQSTGLSERLERIVIRYALDFSLHGVCGPEHFPQGAAGRSVFETALAVSFGLDDLDAVPNETQHATAEKHVATGLACESDGAALSDVRRIRGQGLWCDDWRPRNSVRQTAMEHRRQSLALGHSHLRIMYLRVTRRPGARTGARAR